MDTKTCGHCVPLEDYKKLHRSWDWMCVLCVVLMLIVAILGVKSMKWREDLLETRIALDNATDRLAAQDIDAAKALKLNVMKARKGR